MGVLQELRQWRNETKLTTSLNTLLMIHQGRNETKLSTNYFTFYGETALLTISFVMKMFAAKMTVTKMLEAKMFTMKLPRTQCNISSKHMSRIQYHTESIFADHRWYIKVMGTNKKIQGETRQKCSSKSVHNDLSSHSRIYSLFQWKEMINSELN